MRWLLALVMALLVALASFVIILWLVAPPRAQNEAKPLVIGHFVPMKRSQAQSQSRSRVQPPEPPPTETPPVPQTPQPPQPQQATPNVKLDLNLPSLPSSVSVQAAAMPSLAGVSAAKAAPAPAPAPAPVSDSGPAEPAPPAGIDSEVVPLNEVLPEYPSQALQRNIEGRVKLAFTITAQGRVENIRVIESSPPNVFDRSARRAAARWRFAPRTENGMAVAREAVKTLEFRLNNKR